jgi:serine racemase
MNSTEEKKTDQKYCITFEKDVLKAASRIQGAAHKTPVLTSQSLISDGKRFFFKVEAFQKTGSFKFRGALNAVKAELEKDQVTSPFPVVTHSSGNHAQALALAAKLASTETRNVSATIVMPKNAPNVKKAAVQDLGGNIVMVENTNEAREGEADRIVASTGASFIHPSEDPRVIAGQGTVCLEFVEQVKEMGEELDAVIIPVGGGGLASGNIISLRALLGDKVKVSGESRQCLLGITKRHYQRLTHIFLQSFLLDYFGRALETGRRKTVVRRGEAPCASSRQQT